MQAVILDVDGVLITTAPIHERAWRRLFDEVPGTSGFTHDDYRTHVDGKPRMDGLRDFLASRAIRLPPEELERLAARKDALFHSVLAEEGVQVHDDACRQVMAWRGAGLKIAFVSSSRNVPRILEQTGLDRLRDVQVDGLSAQRLGLRGKRELFLEAARQLGVDPRDAVVVEDAEAGVQAAVDGGFGEVVGLARHGGEEGLREHGAHRVVRTLDELQGALA